jgi:hypothetical protein
MRWRLPLELLQEFQYARLAADLVGTPVAERVWDSPPEGTKLPLVLLGDCTLTSTPHAKGVPVCTVTVQVDVYSDNQGMQQVQQLADAVSQSITTSPRPDFSAGGFSCFDVTLGSCQLLREYDGARLIRRALMTFVFKVEDLIN